MQLKSSLEQDRGDARVWQGPINFQFRVIHYQHMIRAILNYRFSQTFKVMSKQHRPDLAA